MKNVFIDKNKISPLPELEQIKELNEQVKCTLQPSTIHGVGVFALRDIKQGEKCYCLPNYDRKWYNVSYKNFDKLLPDVREIILQRHSQVVNGSLFLSPNDDALLIMFMNHSNTPNYDPVTDTALMDIKKGEELTENYRTMDNYKLAFPFLQ